MVGALLSWKAPLGPALVIVLGPGDPENGRACA